MIDFHCHLLPGIDDGPEAVEEALRMARALAAAGYSAVCCTPHCIAGSYDNDPNTVRLTLDQLQGAIDRAGIALRLLPGMEYYLDEFFPRHLDRLQPLGASDLLLVEAPSQAAPGLVLENVERILRRRLTPLFAHPERYDPFASAAAGTGLFERFLGLFRMAGETPVESDLLAGLKRRGCRFQGNLGSLLGAYGDAVRRRSEQFLRQGIYSCLGTDGHSFDSLQRTLAGARGLGRSNPAVRSLLATPLAAALV